MKEKEKERRRGMIGVHRIRKEKKFSFRLTGVFVNRDSIIRII